MRTVRSFATVALIAAVACSSPEDGTSSGLPDVPSDVPTLEPRLLPADNRSAPPIEPIEDLRPHVSGEPVFFAPSRLAVARDGRIFVLDENDQTIRIVAPDGRLLGSLAGEGQGPGELSGAVAGMAVAGSRLLVADAILARLTAWDLDDLSFDTIAIAAGEGMVADALDLIGFDDGTFGILYSRPGVRGRAMSRAVRLDAAGNVLIEYGELPEHHTTIEIGGRSALLPVAHGQNQMVAAADGGVYLTEGERYEIVAIAAGGAPRWVLRAAWPRAAMPDEEIERALGVAARTLRAMGESAEGDREAIDGLRETLPALQAIKVDGAGRLWVFPYVDHPPGQEPPAEYWPADVYGADGELLYSGSIPARFALHPARGAAWVAAAGDHVYGFETDANGNRVLVGHRVTLPEAR
jgi:hypothetical protein